MEQSRNGRHINTDAAISQKKAAQKKSAAAKRRVKKKSASTKPAEKKQAPAKKASGKTAGKAPAKRPAQKAPTQKQKQQNAKRNAQLQNARANGQKKTAQGKKKRKYKINYRRLITSIIGLLLIILALVLLIHAIAHHGSKKGWYNVYVSPTTSDCRIGVVTELDENGVPAKVDLTEEVKEGVFAVPIQCGGTSTIIVTDKDYSFNKVNPYNPNYYLASVQGEFSSDAAKQAEFEDKYQPSIVEVTDKTIGTQSLKDLPGITLYGNKGASDKVGEASVGSPQPSIPIKKLDYTGKKKPAAPVKTDESATFTFSASGDNLIHQKIYQQASTRANGSGYDFNYAYEGLSSFYQQHDLNWINQESLLSNKLGPASYPTFSTPGEDGQALYNLLNMRVFSVANNHIYDQGSAGIEATTEFYENDMPDDVLYTGLWDKNDTDSIPVYTAKGKSIAFLSYTYGTNGISTPEAADKRVIYTSETDLIKKQVKKANKIADIVIVGCHWGTEDSHVITDDQKKLAQNLANWGADLIVGTHPHVVQNAEWINSEDGRNVFCAYSLGNFISTQALADQIVGLVLDVTFDTVTTPEGEVTVVVKNPKLVPTVTVYGADYANVHVVWYRDFTETDAMNHGVKISNSNFSYLWVANMLKQYVNTDFLELPDSTAGNALNGELSEPEETEESTSEGASTSASSTSTTAAGTAASTAASTTAAATTARTTVATTTAAPTTAASTTAATSSAATGPTVGEGRITNGPVGLAAAGN
ncbi:MAG: CapA family protein [Clostridia bacterium]|nr:CapA family protein [Clostridia bacterium]